jgi:uncharacterized membrane protein (DUF485 family)
MDSSPQFYGVLFLLMCTLFCVYYNLTLFAAFDTCFFGTPWEWDTFGRFLLRALPIIH